MNKRTRLVYAVLIAVWAIIVVWQIVEHDRVRHAGQAALINRAKDISTTVGVVMRSQRRFGIIPMDRMESALKSLIKPGELNAIALLNSVGEVVVSAGDPIDFDTKDFIRTGEHWGSRTVALMNLVDLGTNMTSELEGGRPTIIVRPPEIYGPFPTNRPPLRSPPPDADRRRATNELKGNANADAPASPPPFRRGWGRSRGPNDRRPPFGRPFWMSHEEYEKAIKKQGVHSFVVLLSVDPMREANGRDLWVRFIITALAGISVVGLGMAWRNVHRSSELELRLVRTAELNTRLKEMNLAAAGLAHETKNPLNIIRGLAQMISKQEDALPEIRQKSRNIIDEADRVTAQLNEFINYSRPREVRRAALALNSIVGEVVRALGYDLEEKAIRLHVQEEMPRIEADEQLLRQALFNLLLNAVQAVGRGGEIAVAAHRQNGNGVVLEIRDNGPGVPPGQREDIFKPYFTTNQKGSGLGLAVVQQIVLAHGWEVRCLDNPPRGAVFRISHIGPASAG